MPLKFFPYERDPKGEKARSYTSLSESPSVQLSVLHRQLFYPTVYTVENVSPLVLSYTLGKDGNDKKGSNVDGSSSRRHNTQNIQNIRKGSFNTLSEGLPSIHKLLLIKEWTANPCQTGINKEREKILFLLNGKRKDRIIFSPYYVKSVLPCDSTFVATSPNSPCPRLEYTTKVVERKLLEEGKKVLRYGEGEKEVIEESTNSQDKVPRLDKKLFFPFSGSFFLPPAPWAAGAQKRLTLLEDNQHRFTSNHFGTLIPSPNSKTKSTLPSPTAVLHSLLLNPSHPIQQEYNQSEKEVFIEQGHTYFSTMILEKFEFNLQALSQSTAVQYPYPVNPTHVLKKVPLKNMKGGDLVERICENYSSVLQQHPRAHRWVSLCGLWEERRHQMAQAVTSKEMSYPTKPLWRREIPFLDDYCRLLDHDKHHSWRRGPSFSPPLHSLPEEGDKEATLFERFLLPVGCLLLGLASNQCHREGPNDWAEDPVRSSTLYGLLFQNAKVENHWYRFPQNPHNRKNVVEAAHGKDDDDGDPFVSTYRCPPMDDVVLWIREYLVLGKGPRKDGRENQAFRSLLSPLSYTKQENSGSGNSASDRLPFPWAPLRRMERTSDKGELNTTEILLGNYESSDSLELHNHTTTTTNPKSMERDGQSDYRPLKEGLSRKFEIESRLLCSDMRALEGVLPAGTEVPPSREDAFGLLSSYYLMSNSLFTPLERWTASLPPWIHARMTKKKDHDMDHFIHMSVFRETEGLESDLKWSFLLFPQGNQGKENNNFTLYNDRLQYSDRIQSKPEECPEDLNRGDCNTNKDNNNHVSDTQGRYRGESKYKPLHHRNNILFYSDMKNDSISFYSLKNFAESKVASLITFYENSWGGAHGGEEQVSPELQSGSLPDETTACDSTPLSATNAFDHCHRFLRRRVRRTCLCRHDKIPCPSLKGACLELFSTPARKVDCSSQMTEEAPYSLPTPTFSEPMIMGDPEKLFILREIKRRKVSLEVLVLNGLKREYFLQFKTFCYQFFDMGEQQAALQLTWDRTSSSPPFPSKEGSPSLDPTSRCFSTLYGRLHEEEEDVVRETQSWVDYRGMNTDTAKSSEEFTFFRWGGWSERDSFSTVTPNFPFHYTRREREEKYAIWRRIGVDLYRLYCYAHQSSRPAQGGLPGFQSPLVLLQKLTRNPGVKTVFSLAEEWEYLLHIDLKRRWESVCARYNVEREPVAICSGDVHPHRKRSRSPELPIEVLCGGPSSSSRDREVQRILQTQDPSVIKYFYFSQVGNIEWQLRRRHGLEHVWLQADLDPLEEDEQRRDSIGQ